MVSLHSDRNPTTRVDVKEWMVEFLFEGSGNILKLMVVMMYDFIKRLKSIQLCIGTLGIAGYVNQSSIKLCKKQKCN